VLVRDTAALAADDGSIVVPAISFVGQGGGQVAIRQKGSQVTPAYVHLWYTPGHWLEWTVDVPRAADYRLAVRYGSRFAARRELRVNGEPAKGLEAFTLQRTGGWTAWAEKRLPETFRLKAGRNLIRLTCLDDTSLCLQGMRLAGAEPGTPDVAIDPLRFTGQGGGEVQKTVSDDLGYFFMWDKAGHAFEWTVDAPEAGPYDVFLWYAALKPTSRELRVNGRVPDGLDAFPLEPTGDWRYWAEARLPAPVELTRGRNVLRLTNTAGTALNLSAIRLAGPGGKDILIGAVDYTQQEGGKVREVRRSRHGSLYLWNDAGHWLEWAVEAPRAGDFRLALRYATRERSPREVQVNGRVVEGMESVTLEPTGDWSAWREARLPARVGLNAGRNLLRMTSLGGGGMNLDEIRLTPAPAAP